MPSIARNGLHGCSVIAGLEQSARNITIPPGPSSRSKMVPKKWSAPRFDTQGSAPRDDVTALDLAALQLQLLDAEKTLHRVGQPGAAENLAAGKLAGEFGDELRIARIRGVPDQRVLAPRHEGGGAADFAERGDRLNGAAQIGRAILRLVAAPCAGFAETPEQRIGVDRALIDAGSQGCEFFARDDRDLIGDRRRREIVYREPGYRQ